MMKTGFVCDACVAPASLWAMDWGEVAGVQRTRMRRAERKPSAVVGTSTIDLTAELEFDAAAAEAALEAACRHHHLHELRRQGAREVG